MVLVYKPQVYTCMLKHYVLSIFFFYSSFTPVLCFSSVWFCKWSLSGCIFHGQQVAVFAHPDLGPLLALALWPLVGDTCCFRSSPGSNVLVNFRSLWLAIDFPPLSSPPLLHLPLKIHLTTPQNMCFLHCSLPQRGWRVIHPTPRPPTH